MLDMIQDGVRVFHLPDDNFCLADEEHRSPLDMEECPKGEEHCTGDCFTILKTLRIEKNSLTKRSYDGVRNIRATFNKSCCRK